MFSSGVSWPHCSAVAGEELAVRPGEATSRPFMLQLEAEPGSKPGWDKQAGSREPGPGEVSPSVEAKSEPSEDFSTCPPAPEGWRCTIPALLGLRGWAAEGRERSSPARQEEHRCAHGWVARWLCTGSWGTGASSLQTTPGLSFLSFSCP